MKNKILNFFGHIKKRDDSELSQAFARIVLSPTVFLIISFLTFFAGYDYSVHTLFISGLHSIYSVFIFFNTLRHPGDHFIRRASNILVDIGAINLVIYFCDTSAIFLYPVMLWVIVGNGARFGIKYLYISLFVAVVFFGGATYFNKDWHDHPELSKSLVAGLVVLAIFYDSLIRKLHYLNATLNKRVRERTKELRHRLYHDSLTELKNRLALDHYMQKRKFFVLMLIDINNFKNYNEIYGVEIGNKILVEFANFLKSYFKGKPYEVFRAYGDGFAVIGGGKNLDISRYEREIANLLKVVSSLKIKIDIGKKREDIDIDITIGISLESDHALEKADMALNYAKSHKLSFIAYNQYIDTKKESENILYWMHEVKRAIANDDIVPVFQPIVDREGNVVKYESLIRLRRKKDGKSELVSPFFFLEIAFKTNLYKKLSIIMIKKTFEAMMEIKEDFSLNLSFYDISDKEVMKVLSENIVKYGVGHRLILEIVESENVEDYKYIKEFVKEFRKFGVRIAIDDFGSGFSNYSHILEIMPDILKIDGSLIKNIHESKNSYILVSSIVSLAKVLNIKTVAEFVHSKEVFEVAKSLGVDEFQGFYFSPPRLKEEIERICEESV